MYKLIIYDNQNKGKLYLLVFISTICPYALDSSDQMLG